MSSDMSDNVSKIKSSLQHLSREAVDLYLGKSVSEVGRSPDPLQFYRDHVSHNRPLIIRGGISHWPALHRWSSQYLSDTLGDKEVTVTATPDGYADAAVGDNFMMPEERRMNMNQFLQNIDNPDDDEVLYIQKQNSNLTDEFREIMEDVDDEIEWASQAFGKSPDAINFWMGDERAVTSSIVLI